MFGGLGPGGLPRTGPDGAFGMGEPGAAVRGGDAGRHGASTRCWSAGGSPVVDPGEVTNGEATRLEPDMIFKQLFEPVSSTTPISLGCEETGQAVLVDPVINAMDHDMQVLQELACGWRIPWTRTSMPTTSPRHWAEEATGSRDRRAGDRPPAVRGLRRRSHAAGGGLSRHPRLHTPGHTDGHF